MTLTLIRSNDKFQFLTRGLIGPAGEDGEDGADGADGIGYLGARERPGDVLDLFTSALSGEAESSPPIAFGSIVTNAEGKALRVPGQSTPAIVASRQDFAVEPGQVYAARWAVTRVTNTADPFGDAVEFRLAWLGADKSYISTALADSRALTVADGRYSSQATFSRDEEADITAPAGARYVRPYVRILGGNGVTDVEVIYRWESIGLPGPKGDVGEEPEYQLDEEQEEIRWRQADGTWGPWLDIGSARKKAEAARDIAAGYASDAVSQGNVPIYATVAGMGALEVPVGINAVRVNGRNTAGDGESGLYIDINNGSNDTFVSGGTTARTWYRAYQEIEQIVSVRDFGAVGDGTSMTGVNVTGTALTTSVGYFTVRDVGKYIEVAGAGTAGAYHRTTIAAFVSSTAVTLTDAAITDVTGAVGLFGTDNAPAFQDALDFWLDKYGSSRAAGVVHVPYGQFLLNSTLFFNSQGLTLRGSGSGAIGGGAGNKNIGGRESFIRATHSDGPVIRCLTLAPHIQDILIDASPARTAGPMSNNYGIHVEGPDTASGYSAWGGYRNFRITSQPSHAMVMVGNIARSYISDYFIDNCGGMGILIDKGSSFGRVNTYTPGQLRIANGRIGTMGGNAIAIGDPDDLDGGSLPGYRVTIANLDAADCCSNPGVAYSQYTLHLDGENHRVLDSGFGGTGSIYLAGLNHKLTNNRYINNTTPIFLDSVGVRRTADIDIDGARVAGAVNTLVQVRAGADVSNVRVAMRHTQNVTTAMVAGIPGAEIIFGGQVTRNAKLMSLDFRSLRSTLIINDDTAVALQFDGTTSGIVSIAASNSGGKAGVAHFGVGAAFCSILSGSAGVVATTGVLTGTTGTDGNLTISPHTDDKLYIENRTGGNRNYQVTFTSVQGGALVAT